MSYWSDSLVLAVYFCPPRAFIVWVHSVVDGNFGLPARRIEIDYFAIVPHPFFLNRNPCVLIPFMNHSLTKRKRTVTPQESCCLITQYALHVFGCFYRPHIFHLTNRSSSSLFHLRSFILQPPQWCLHSVSEILDIWLNIWWGKWHFCNVFITKLCQAATGKKKREKLGLIYDCSVWNEMDCCYDKWNGSIKIYIYFHSNRNMYNSYANHL